MNLKRFNEITIIGPGLIGASLGLALKANKIAKKIVGIDTSKINIKHAIKNKSIDEGRLIIDERIKLSEIIFVCTPVSTIDRIVRNVFPFLTENSIITDVGSVKNCFSKKTYSLFKKKACLIPGHPIAGTEFSGARYAQKDLFKNKWCIILNNGNKKKIKKIEIFWKKLGSKIIFMNAIEHDKIFSITSHLPHLIAYNLVKTATDFQRKNKKNIIKYSAGGLRDFSRTAASNEIMWRDIFFNNKDNIMSSINIFIKNLNNLKKLIKKENNKNILKILKDTKKVRRQIIDLKQDISKPNFGRDIF